MTSIVYIIFPPYCVHMFIPSEAHSRCRSELVWLLSKVIIMFLTIPYILKLNILYLLPDGDGVISAVTARPQDHISHGRVLLEHLSCFFPGHWVKTSTEVRLKKNVFNWWRSLLEKMLLKLFLRTIVINFYYHFQFYYYS